MGAKAKAKAGEAQSIPVANQAEALREATRKTWGIPNRCASGTGLPFQLQHTPVL